MEINFFNKQIKYILVSALLYVSVFFLLWFLVDKLFMDNLLAYFLVYLSVYTLDYLLTLRWVFKKKHNKIIIIKYLIYLIAFLGINTLIYKIISGYVYYIYAAFIVAVLLFPLRYIASSLWVYK